MYRDGNLFARGLCRREPSLVHGSTFDSLDRACKPISGFAGRLFLVGVVRAMRSQDVPRMALGILDGAADSSIDELGERERFSPVALAVASFD
jgi:hypothetical protein